MPRMRSWIAVGVLATAMTVVGIACGDDDDEDPTPGSTPTTETTTPGETATAGTLDDTATSPAETETSTTSAETPTAGAGETTTPAPGSTDDVTVDPSPDPVEEQANLVAVRLGVHPEDGGWERIVFEFDGDQLPGATIGYVDEAARCGSGEAVEVTGEAILSVRISDARAHDDDGELTVDPLEVDGPGQTIGGGEQICDFEAQVEWVFGIAGEHNFRVTTLEGPTRLVIDVDQ